MTKMFRVSGFGVGAYCNTPVLWLLIGLFLSPLTSRLTPVFAASGCGYPTVLETFTDVAEAPAWQITAATEDPLNRKVSYNKLQACVEKIIAELGTLPKGSYADVKTRLNDAVYFGVARPANSFLGGPISGADANPAFRALVAGDIPSLDAAKITTGIFGLARGGTNQTAWTAARCVRVNAGGTALEAAAGDCTTGGGASTHNLLSATHPDTLTASPVLGDLLSGNSTPAWARIAGNTTTAKQFLSQTGTGTVSAAPVWAAITDADIPDTITLTNITQISNRAIADTTGTLLEARGGTGQATYTLGDLLYASATNTLAKKAGNTTTTRQFLSQTGTGSVSAAPVWAALTDADIPDTLTLASPTVSGTIAGTYTIGGTPTLGSTLNLNGQTMSGDTTFTGNTNFPGTGIMNTAGNWGLGTTTPVQRFEVVGGQIKVTQPANQIGFHLFNPDTPFDDSVEVGRASPVLRLTSVADSLVGPGITRQERFFDLVVEPLGLGSGVSNPYRFVLKAFQAESGLISNRLEFLAKGALTIFDQMTIKQDADTLGMNLYSAGGPALVDNSARQSPYLRLVGQYDSNAAVGPITQTDYNFEIQHRLSAPISGSPISRLAFKDHGTGSGNGAERFSVWNSGNVALGGITNFTGVTAPGLVLPNASSLYGINGASNAALNIASINTSDRLVTRLWTWPLADGTIGKVLATDGTGNLDFVVNGGNAITALTGDVTATGPGSVAATIANAAVTYAKIQNISATNRLLGRSTIGAGSIEEITVGGDLTQSGSTFTICSGCVGNSKLRTSGALSVVGRSANTIGFVGDIQATAASGAVLRESGSVIDWGTVATAGIADGAITYAKIQNVTDARLLGRSSGIAGPPIEITVGSGLSLSAGALTTNITPGNLPAGFVDATTDLAATLCADTQILKKVTGVWACAADATGGMPSWDTIGSPIAAQALTMGANNTTWTWGSASGVFKSSFTSAFTTGPQWLIEQVTGNPTGGTLFELKAADIDVTVFKAGDGINGISLSQAGALTAIGTGQIQANRTICTGTDYLKADGTCASPGGVGAGDNITVNGVAAADANFANATPAAPANAANVRWQKDASTPNNLSAHLLFSDVAAATFGAGAGFAWTFDAGVTDPVITFSSGVINVSTGTLQQAGTAVALQSRTLTGGAGIAAIGDLSADRTIATASGEADFLASGALTCGAATQGKMQVHTTPLQYCDNAATPALQYAAYGDSTGKAITNANLTGPITSVGNATSVAAQTGTGSTFVMNTAPAITGGTHTALTGLGIRSTGTGAFDLRFANAENLTLSDKTLTIALNDANRTLTVSGNATISGTNTGDQTITLTGDVTGSGTGSFATIIGANKVTLGMLATGTAGNLITYDATGAPAAVATGTATQVLTSNGAGAAPTFQSAASGGTTINVVRKTADQSSTVITLADVTGLSFSAAASTNYIFEFTVFYTAAVATTGIGLAVNGPASPTEIQGSTLISADGTGGINVYASAFAAYDTFTASARSNGTTVASARIRGIFRNGINAGTFILRFASEIDTSTVTVKAGSFLTYHTF